MKCPIKPMLARSYKADRAADLFPAFAQPKLDGYRCLAIHQPNRPALLFSRNQKSFSVPHIADAVLRMISLHDLLLAKDQNIILDGELYLHGCSFGDVQSLITREGHPDQTKLSYYIYDCFLPNDPNARMGTRQQILDAIITKYRYEHKRNDLVRVPNIRVNTPAQYDKAHSLFVEQEYEGSILRTMGTVYEQKRSSSLLKRKDFLEGDYYISEINRGQGKNANAAIFTCLTPQREEFTVTAHGNYEEKSIPIIHPKRYLGKFLTVKYQELTEDGIPRFPVALGLKNDRRPGAKSY